MRRSYIQPSQHNQQGLSSDEKKRKEDSSSKLLREETRDQKAISSSAASHGGAEKKAGPPETETTRKLERKSTEDINASADEFIKNFRQQLLIQRLQSIENYEQMLARGL